MCLAIIAFQELVRIDMMSSERPNRSLNVKVISPENAASKSAHAVHQMQISTMTLIILFSLCQTATGANNDIKSMNISYSYFNSVQSHLCSAFHLYSDFFNVTLFQISFPKIHKK